MTPDDLRHGTKRGHVLGCRLECCRRANTLYQNLWRMGRTNKTVDGTGTLRRLQALRVMGWSAPKIAEAGGFASEGAVRGLLGKQRQGAAVWATTAAAAVRAFDALSMKRGPCNQVRNQALRDGWLPPLAWDNIDDPDEIPHDHHRHDRHDVDEVIVLRALAGEPVKANLAERRVIAARWKGQKNELARLLKSNIWRDLRDAG